MIKKLDIKNGGVEDLLNCIKKINELIDVVNEFEKDREEIKAWIAIVSDLRSRVPVVESRVSILEEHAHPTATTDIYAEQRNWIGKLCHFWNKTEYTDDIYGFLTDIVPTNKYKPEDNYFVPFKDEFGSFYEHCEPVKPDDDIIYKGE